MLNFKFLKPGCYWLSVALIWNILISGGLAQPESRLAEPATPDQVVESGSRPMRFNLDALTHPEQMRRRGAPGGRTGAGTRGDCPALAAAKPGLTAIVPAVADAQATPLGTTTQAQPTISVYIPYDATALQSIRFVLLDDSENPVLPEPLTIVTDQIPGIVNIQFPETVSLEVGRYYRWYVLIDCQPAGATDVFVTALIQRVELTPELTRQLVTLTPRDRIVFYAQQGIWHDALIELQNLNRAAPSPALSADWASLLESVGLESLGAATRPSP